MANKILQKDETPITWASSGATEAITLTSLASAAGRQGAHHDFGTSARSRLFAWRAYIKPGGTRVVGEGVRIYLKTSDGTHHDNDDGTGDIALSSLDKVRNVRQLGAIVIDENAAVEMVASGMVDIGARYAAPIFYNGTANTLSSTAGDFGFSLTPIPDEIQ
jgi:hypothetical protein